MLALIGAMAMSLVALVFSQGYTGSSIHPSYDPKKPLPLALPEAYGLALATIGSATNRFHCVAASCTTANGERSQGWTFGFANTNGAITQVKVFFYDKQVFIDTNSASLLK